MINEFAEKSLVPDHDYYELLFLKKNGAREGITSSICQNQTYFKQFLKFLLKISEALRKKISKSHSTMLGF